MDSYLLALTTSTRDMQSCFKIYLGLIKLSNVMLISMSESKSFLVTIMKWDISGQGYKHLIRFSRFVLF